MRCTIARAHPADWFSAGVSRFAVFRTRREPLAGLIRRGHRDGSFDRHLSDEWLLTVFFALLHAAAEQRLEGHDEANVAAALSHTTLKAFLPAGSEAI